MGTVLPKTLAGLSVWILLLGVGAAASGVAFFAFYQYKLASLEQRINGFADRFDKDAKQRTKEFSTLVKDSKAEIEKTSRLPSRQANEVASLLTKIAPSISYVLGQDAAGAPATGSGFVVTSTPTETWVITNFRLVAGAALKKAPVTVRLNGADQPGDVYSWDEGRDLALIIAKVGNLPVPEWAPGDPEVSAKIWALGSSPGKLKASASGGVVLDAGPDGLLVDAAVPASSSGGPVLDRDGKVLGVLTASYAPVGYSPSSGWAVPIRVACQKIIRCP